MELLKMIQRAERLGFLNINEIKILMLLSEKTRLSNAEIYTELDFCESYMNTSRSASRKLQDKKLIESTLMSIDGNRPSKFFTITALGRKLADRILGNEN